jgi:very-short-patch-repair endonuclease
MALRAPSIRLINQIKLATRISAENKLTLLIPEPAHPMSLTIQLECSERFTCSLEDGSVPLLWSLALRNGSENAVSGVVLELTSEPAFFEPKQWAIDAISGQATVNLDDLALRAVAGFGARLAGGCDAVLRFRAMHDGQELASLQHKVTLIPPEPGIEVTADASINYAFQQNAIPMIKELLIRNNGVARRDLVFRISSEPAFTQPAEVRLQALEPAGRFRICPPHLNLTLSPSFLAELTERVNGLLKIEMVENGTVIQSHSKPISLLTRNEWCGLVALPEILAAFVLPNDPAVSEILRRASDLLKETTGRSDLNGYQDKNRQRAWEQVAAIYRAIAEQRIRYINPPASFENTGQKVRFPSDIKAQQFGTCLDLALLFAACLEQAGLRPFLFLHEGHAYSGCWLEAGSLPLAAGDDLQQIRKLERDQLIVVFEAVTVTNSNPGRIDDAALLAKPYLETDLPFRLALDVHAARSAKILPLPIPGQAPADGQLQEPDPGAVGHGPLTNRQIAEPVIVSAAAPAMPASRIELWKSRLLDLSLRNRLLNIRETKATIRILAEPGRVEDELASERPLSLRPRPHLMSDADPRDAAVYTAAQRADALKEHLHDELGKGRLHTHLDEAEHIRRLTELYRSARTALEENGTNTLYAAVGIIEWRETEHGDRSHRAPLLLIPVELKRKSVLEGFTLQRIDEDARLNVTLMEMLRQNFRKEIGGLDPLPEDDKGVNVDLVLQTFRDAVRDMKGWEVKEEVWLSEFSFTKFLLWKDLSDRIEDLKKNRIVSHLINAAGTAIDNPSEDIPSSVLDAKFHPREILCPRSADSSQLAAVMAAADGQDFILEGPPGTGKSQTITNIIAHCLAVGKRVLFVAEKRAALDVVHRRLREDGLEPFCLELHSNKSGKSDVLAQFGKTLAFAEANPATDWEQQAQELQRLRDSLNGYTRALHEKSGCGLSAYDCIDYLLPRAGEPTVRLESAAHILSTSREELSAVRESARQLQARSRNLQPISAHPLKMLRCAEWSPNWAEQCTDLNAVLLNQCGPSAAALEELTGWMNFSGKRNKANLAHLDDLVDLLAAPPPCGPGVATTPWPQLSAALKACRQKVVDRDQLRRDLAVIHPADPGQSKLPCERQADDDAVCQLQRTRAIHDAIAETQNATAAAAAWFGLNGALPRERLARMASLAGTILDARDVGSAFPLAPWNEWSPEISRWIDLLTERVDLRKDLADFDEAALLSLDSGMLGGKWNQSLGAWFVPKFFLLQSIRGLLRKALRPGVTRDLRDLGKVVPAVLRLAEVQNELAEVAPHARELLAASWNGGEPDIAGLRAIHEWGTTLNRDVDALADGDAAWSESFRERLAHPLQQGCSSLTAGSETGALLTLFRERLAETTREFDSFSAAVPLRTAAASDPAGYFEGCTALLRRFSEGASRIRDLNLSQRNAAPLLEGALGQAWNGGEPQEAAIRECLDWAGRLQQTLLSLAGEDFGWLASFRQHLAGLIGEGLLGNPANAALSGRFTRFRLAMAGFRERLADFGSAVHLDFTGIDESDNYLQSTEDLARGVSAAWHGIRTWCAWQKERTSAISSGLAPLVAQLESGDGCATDAEGLFERSFRRALLFAIIEKESALRDFFGHDHDERIARFREIDERLGSLSRDIIRARLAAGIPRDQKTEDIPREEVGLLRRELAKKARHIPVRQLISRIPSLLPRLKPCVLMSPLSVAQYLDAAHSGFDVVIFDEASQIPVWDAIGAIARGQQLIVVGDPKQLPPTNFFASAGEDDDDRTPDEHKDLESILDELLSHGLRPKRLNWHYRSRHEGLIAFSNRQYYDNALLTFPSPALSRGGVCFRHIPDARYDKGRSRTNRLEAQALVHELVTRLRSTDGPVRSYGVVTFSQAQQSLIENLLDEERRKFPEIEIHFGDAPPVEGEPVFVKNLENVQGDERDVILFSICYGPDEAGKISMNFGPLNRDGGERRLNVAVTRAKHEIMVFAGLRGEQLDLTKTRSRGLRDLKYFLEYAERGPSALTAAVTSASLSEAESEFERMVADRIRGAGFEVHHQVGCSGYRIDLGIVDPAAPGSYLLGVECDGATYHRAHTARDRDKLRQSVLEGLGWKLHRIWSTDWWHHSDAEMAKLIETIRGLSDSGDSAQQPSTEVGHG